MMKFVKYLSILTAFVLALVVANGARADTLNAPALSPTPSVTLLGNWLNVNHSTRGITRINLSQVGGVLKVHAYGKCHPTDCDWGVVDGTVYAPSVDSHLGTAFTAHYNPGFEETILVGYVRGSYMVAINFTRFTDGSGRSNYYSIELFHK